MSDTPAPVPCRPFAAALVLLCLCASAIADDDAKSRAEAALRAGVAALEAGEHDKAIEQLEQAKGLFEPLKDPRGVVAARLADAARALKGGDAAGAAEQYVRAGAVYLQTGKNTEAAALFRRGMKTAQAVDADAVFNRAWTMYGQALMRQGKHDEAMVELRGARDRMAESDVRTASIVVSLIARIHFARGEFGLAAQELESGLVLAEKAQYAAAINQAVDWLAWTYLHLEDYERALPYYQRVLDDALSQGDTQRIETAYSNLAAINYEMGRYDEALRVADTGDQWGKDQTRPALRRELTLLRARVDVATGNAREGIARYKPLIGSFTRSGMLPRVVTVQVDLARALSRIGQSEQAMRYLRTAERTASKLKDDAALARIFIEQAGCAYQLGAFDEALRTIDQAYAAARRAKDRRNEAVSVALMGTIRWALGAYDTALANHRDARKRWKAIGDRRREMLALGNEAAVLTALHRDKEAAELIGEAVAGAANEGQRAAFLTTLSTLQGRAGEAEQALATAGQALEAAKRSGEPLGVVQAQILVGGAMVRAGQDDEGLAMIAAAAEEAHSWRRPTIEVSARNVLAQQLLKREKYEEARRQCERAAREIEDILGGLGDIEGGLARSRYAGVFEGGAMASARLDDARSALRFLEKGRASLLRESMGARSHVRYEDMPAELRRAEAQAKARVLKARAEMDRLAQSSKRKERRAGIKELDAAIAYHREVVARIQREAKAQARLYYPRAAELPQLQAALGEGQAFVVYGMCYDEVIAVIVTPDSDRVVSLGSRQLAVGMAVQCTADSPEADTSAAMAKLKAQLVDPLKLPETITSVVVSPDGPLARVPLAQLFGGRTLVMTPSATTYAQLADEIVEAGTQVLALGDPAYAQASDGAAATVYTRGVVNRGDEDGQRGALLHRLPATGPEAKAVGDVVLLGEQASEAGFAAQLAAQPRWRAVHFACHGLVSPVRPDLSALALSRSKEGAEVGPHLALDGFLTTTEVMRMRVPADLAVLSACVTGRGQELPGSGLFGLARSFIQAGSHRVICSLWKVDDEATGALMRKFYELWNPKEGKGMPAAKALRAAQEHIRAQEKWKHPYYWSGWVLWGLSS